MLRCAELVSDLREQELAHLCWEDLDIEHVSIRVVAKPEWNFFIKDHEEGNVTIPYSHMNALWELKQYTPKGAEPRLVFPGANGQPERHMLGKLKITARNAGLNCGTCETCLKRKECGNLVSPQVPPDIRNRTGARLDYDLASIRKQLGHKPGSEATFRYLAPLHHQQIRENGLERLFEGV
jgi:integrase